MLSHLLGNNRAWSKAKTDQDPSYFQNLSALQRPEYLWIGCSDSRVPANVITGLEPGEVFVHRNVANLVHPADINLLSVLEFAVNTLNVKHIIVCGHYGCGGIRAAIDGASHGIIDHWLQPIRDLAHANFSCEECTDADEETLDRLCQFSIAEQVRKLAGTPIIQAAWENGADLNIHGWVYGLKDGLLTDLKCSVGPPAQK